MLQLSEQFPQKMYKRELEARKDLSDVQSGLNKWLFSLKEDDDPSHKHYERCKSSSDPNRALWAHVSKVSHEPKMKARKALASPSHRNLPIGVEVR